jgi:hypothetical protein
MTYVKLKFSLKKTKSLIDEHGKGYLKRCQKFLAMVIAGCTDSTVAIEVVTIGQTKHQKLNK